MKQLWSIHSMIDRTVERVNWVDAYAFAIVFTDRTFIIFDQGQVSVHGPDRYDQTAIKELGIL